MEPVTAAALGALEWARRVAGDRPGQDRVVVLGLAPVEGAPAFWPALTLGRSGARLEEDAGRPPLEVFALANVLDRHDDPTRGPWARRRGRSVKDHLRGRRVVVLGRDAWRLLDVDVACGPRAPAPYAWHAVPRLDEFSAWPRLVAVLPHPSSRSRTWNDAAARRASRAWWRALAREEAARLGIASTRAEGRRAVVRAAIAAGVPGLADLAVASRWSIARWASGESTPSPEHRARLEALGIPQSVWK